MKILVYGAGVLGSLLGYRLLKAGHQVRFLARGQRLADLRERGLQVQSLTTAERDCLPVDVIDHLDPSDPYDLVLVVMGYPQAVDALAPLAASTATPNVLFIGNNVAGQRELAAALGSERVMLGFLLASGTIRGGVVHYAAGVGDQPARLVIGEPYGAHPRRIKVISSALLSTGFEVEISRRIEDWLKCHAAVILPLAGGLYAAGGDVARFAHTRDAQVLSVRAMREGIDVLRANHIAIQPNALKLMRFLPEPLVVNFLARLLSNPTFQIALIHAEQARPELQELAVRFMVLAHETGATTPALARLCRYICAPTQPLPAGSRAVRLDVSGLWAYSMLFTALGLTAGWLTRRIIKPGKMNRRS